MHPSSLGSFHSSQPAVLKFKSSSTWDHRDSHQTCCFRCLVPDHLAAFCVKKIGANLASSTVIWLKHVVFAHPHAQCTARNPVWPSVTISRITPGEKDINAHTLSPSKLSATLYSSPPLVCALPYLGGDGIVPHWSAPPCAEGFWGDSQLSHYATPSSLCLSRWLHGRLQRWYCQGRS